MKLRGYQRDAIQAVREHWYTGDPNALIVLATGLGKTIIFTTIGKELRMEGLRRVLILAHRTELVQQAVDKWLKVDPSERIGIYQGARKDLSCDVIAASVASCYPDVYGDRPCRCTQGAVLKDESGWPTGACEILDPDPKCPDCEGKGTTRTLTRRGRIHDLPLAEIDLVIIDEVHHVTRESLYMQVVNAVRAANPAALLLGVTATPYRTDERGLGFLFRGVCFTMGINAGIQSGYLAPLRGRRVELSLDLSQVRVSKTTGDFRDEDLGAVMDTPEARTELVKAWKEHAGAGTLPGGDVRGRLTAVFCPTVDAAEHLAGDFAEAGVASDWICGDKKRCSDDRRRAVLRRYGQGDIRVLVNVGVLTEGWDEPATACIVVARPTKSRVLFVQMVGRGTRLLGLTYEDSVRNGKEDCLVLDCAGASKVGLVSMADLSTYDEADPEVKDPDELPEPEPEAQPELDFPDAITTRRVVGHTTFDIDLFGGGVHWARVNGSRVASIDAGRTIVLFHRPADEQGKGAGHVAILTGGRGGAVQVLAEGVTELEAMRAAETYAVTNGKEKFLKPGDWFTKNPATEKQRTLLTRLLRYNRKGAEPVDPATLSMAQASAWCGYLLARLNVKKYGLHPPAQDPVHEPAEEGVL